MVSGRSGGEEVRACVGGERNGKDMLHIVGLQNFRGGTLGRMKIY